MHDVAMTAQDRGRVPNGLRGAGLLMILGTLIWVLMPLGIALGLNLSDGIGVYLFNSKTPLIVTPSMLLWLTPLSLLTSIAGSLLYFGRAARLGLVVTAAWFVLGIAVAPAVSAVAAFIAWCIWTGTRRSAATL